MSDVVQVYLTRRNLLTLLSKLDRVKNGEESQRTIGKHDTKHKKYPQTHRAIYITAVEDADYYSDRDPGPVHPMDNPDIKG